MKPFTVYAARCDYRADDETVYRCLRKITDPLERSWTRLGAAKLIALKVNIAWPPERIRIFQGRRQELVDDSVLRATLRLLSERTHARLVVMDTTYHPIPNGVGRDVHFLPLLREFGAEYVEFNAPPFASYEVPGGGFIFHRYLLGELLRQADAVVSVAKLKNHGFTGVTLCLKNLFGLCTMPPAGRPRNYYHHLIRLPYVLADLGMIVQPCLNIVDGLVGQAGKEWGGEARVANTLIAGDHVIATDACATYLMGHDPNADYPSAPFRFDRNPLRVAAEHGFGTTNLQEIEFVSDIAPPVAEFYSDQPDPPDRVANWRRTTCQQALYYQAHQGEFTEQFAGEFIYLQDEKVVWHGSSPEQLGSRRVLSGKRKESALWLKWVDPAETEGEQFQVYADELSRLQTIPAG